MLLKKPGNFYGIFLQRLWELLSNRKNAWLIFRLSPARWRSNGTKISWRIVKLSELTGGWRPNLRSCDCRPVGVCCKRWDNRERVMRSWNWLHRGGTERSRLRRENYGGNGTRVIAAETPERSPAVETPQNFQCSSPAAAAAARKPLSNLSRAKRHVINAHGSIDWKMLRLLSAPRRGWRFVAPWRVISGITAVWFTVTVERNFDLL